LLYLLRSIPPSHPCGTPCAIHDVMMALHDCMPVKRRRLLVPRLHVRFAASDWSVTVKPGRYRLFRLWPAAFGPPPLGLLAGPGPTASLMGCGSSTKPTKHPVAFCFLVAMAVVVCVSDSPQCCSATQRVITPAAPRHAVQRRSPSASSASRLHGRYADPPLASMALDRRPLPCPALPSPPARRPPRHRPTPTNNIHYNSSHVYNSR
jgi:hypothetical protein